ncbi:hypothetical protein V5F49_03670 [Xanthobacter sp. V3C-3]
MNGDKMAQSHDALADLYEAAARKTAEPIKFDTDETADSETEN